MRAITFLGAFLLLTLGVAALAQEGHPLTGTWHGEWGPASAVVVWIGLITPM